MERYIEDAINRAIGLRKNAIFALNNALGFAMTSMGIPTSKSRLFSVKFNDDNDTHEVYWQDKGLGVDIEGFVEMDKTKIALMIGGDETEPHGNMLLPDTDYIK